MRPFVFLLPYALLGCPTAKVTLDGDTGEPPEEVVEGDVETVWEDTSVETDTDETDETDDTAETGDPVPDSGLARLLFYGTFETPAGAYVSGSFGYAAYGLREEAVVCSLVGSMDLVGPADGCPSCDWSFELSAIRDSVAEGEVCSDFGIRDGLLDGALAASWGFAATYDFDYNGTIYRLENAVLVRQYDDPWTPWFFNYGGDVKVTGDADGVSFWNIANESYYYYYP